MDSLTERAFEIVSGALTRAADRCAARGVKLTATPQRVLGLLLAAERPLGAYGLIALLQSASGKVVAPPTVYRALQFLVEQGLAHRIERLDAYVACSAAARGDGHSHPHQFLVCRRCGRAEELSDTAVQQALSQAAIRSGFAFEGATVEMEGQCAHCAGGHTG